MDKPVVVVSVCGEVFSWTEGFFSGSSESLSKDIRAIARAKREQIKVHAMGLPVTVGEDNPRAAAAAMISLDPGRALILRGGEFVFNDDENSFEKDDNLSEVSDTDNIDLDSLEEGEELDWFIEPPLVPRPEPEDEAKVENTYKENN